MCKSPLQGSLRVLVKCLLENVAYPPDKSGLIQQNVRRGRLGMDSDVRRGMTAYRSLFSYKRNRRMPNGTSWWCGRGGRKTPLPDSSCTDYNIIGQSLRVKAEILAIQLRGLCQMSDVQKGCEESRRTVKRQKSLVLCGSRA